MGTKALEKGKGPLLCTEWLSYSSEAIWVVDEAPALAGGCDPVTRYLLPGNAPHRSHGSPPAPVRPRLEPMHASLRASLHLVHQPSGRKRRLPVNTTASAMPSDDYASFSGGGALKLKGGKIGKSKKKKKDKASDLERSLSTGGSGGEAKLDPDKKRAKSKAIDDGRPEEAPEDDADEGLADHKTEAERRHEEAQRKKVRAAPLLPGHDRDCWLTVPPWQFLKLSEGARPELLKTHKERVEELNTYLSKLSEHHDMPKIGPG